jgi:hypothetical protein
VTDEDMAIYLTISLSEYEELHERIRMLERRCDEYMRLAERTQVDFFTYRRRVLQMVRDTKRDVFQLGTRR